MRKPVRSTTVAYVLKGFPRLSETFIASEIYRLERQGLALRLFILKRSAEPVVHSISNAIEASQVFLPQAEAISNIRSPMALRACRAFSKPLLRQSGATGTDAQRGVAGIRACRPRAQGNVGVAPQVAAEGVPAGGGAGRRVHDAGDVRHIHAHFCHSATTVAWLASIMTALPMSFTAHAKDLTARA